MLSQLEQIKKKKTIQIHATGQELKQKHQQEC